MTGSGFVGTRWFRRSLQTDDYSCGPRSVFAVVRHFVRSVTYAQVLRALRPSAENGTSIAPMLRFLRRHRLRVGYRPTMKFADLWHALGRGAVVIVHLDGDHLAVCHAASDRYVWLADPSLRRMLGRRLTRKRFRQRWTRWGLVIRNPDAGRAR